MRTSLAALALGSVLFVAPSPGAALTLEDCERWRSALRGEVAQVEVSGTQARQERKALLDDLDDAAVPNDDPKRTAESMRKVKEFRKRAARLAAEGRVGEQEGQRLDILSDTYRHCVEQVEK